jgi:protein-disulfide isomerase
MLIFFTSFIARKRFSDKSFFKDLFFSLQHFFKNRILIVGTCIIALLFIATKLYLPHYWNLENSPISTNLPTGVTESGHPWIGAENPVLTIEEYTDYQCFQCAKTHFMLRSLIENNRTSLRLVHRHYPMDQEFNSTVVQDVFHIGSGKMALLAIYAMTQNKFWQMNDALFQLARSREPFNTRYLAEKTGIPSPELVAALSHPDTNKLLNLDIRQGMKLRITGTPSFVIEGKVFQGSIPLDILQKIQQ